MLILPLLVAGLGELFGALLGFPDQLGSMLYWLTAMAIAWACVWLVAPWLRARRRFHRTLSAWAVMLVAGIVANCGYCGFSTFDSDALVRIVYWGAVSLPLVAGVMISGYVCRRSCRTSVFMLWLVLWIPVVCAPSLAAATAIHAMAKGQFEALIFIACSSVMGTPILAGCLYVLNVPVMLLARFSPLWRERFHALLGPMEPDPFDAVRESRPLVMAELSSSGEEGEGESPFAQGDSGQG